MKTLDLYMLTKQHTVYRYLFASIYNDIILNPKKDEKILSMLGVLTSTSVDIEAIRNNTYESSIYGCDELKNTRNILNFKSDVHTFITQYFPEYSVLKLINVPDELTNRVSQDLYNIHINIDSLYNISHSYNDNLKDNVENNL